MNKIESVGNVTPARMMHKSGAFGLRKMKQITCWCEMGDIGVREWWPYGLKKVI